MRKTLWIQWIFIATILFVIGVRYYDSIVRRDFLIEATISCDPMHEACFAWDCDVETDPTCDQTPYKKIALPAYSASHCLEENDCPEFSCEAAAGCTTTYCSDETREEWELCTEFVLLPSETVLLTE